MYETIESRIYEELKRVARAGGTISYIELLKKVAPLDSDLSFPGAQLRLLLNAIVEREYKVYQGQRPCLTALVINEQERMPGKGYFDWMKSHGYTWTDERTFWEEQLARVHEFYKNPRRRK